MIRAVLFDLDGTLLDTAADLVASLNHVREHERLEPVAVRDFRHWVSRGAMGLISAGLPPAAGDRVDERKKLLLEHYAANSTLNTVAFEGIDDLLMALASRGIPWGVVTNKPEYLTMPILQELGLLQRAACVVCGDTLSHSKPHPAPVRLACEIVSVDPAHALMVGDDLRDIQAGQAAGAQTALAAYGYLDPSMDLAGLGDCTKVGHPREILDLVDRTSVR